VLAEHSHENGVTCRIVDNAEAIITATKMSACGKPELTDDPNPSEPGQLAL
jgi:hypothetical protein